MRLNLGAGVGEMSKCRLRSVERERGSERPLLPPQFDQNRRKSVKRIGRPSVFRVHRRKREERTEKQRERVDQEDGRHARLKVPALLPEPSSRSLRASRPRSPAADRKEVPAVAEAWAAGPGRAAHWAPQAPPPTGTRPPGAAGILYPAPGFGARPATPIPCILSRPAVLRAF